MLFKFLKEKHVKMIENLKDGLMVKLAESSRMKISKIHTIDSQMPSSCINCDDLKW